MTIFEKVAQLRARMDALEAELASERPTEPPPPLSTAEMVLQSLHLSEGAPKRPVLLSPETYDAIQEYARNRTTVQVGDRQFTLVRDEAAPPFSAALAMALAESL
jgi:hypothetical protein